MDLFSNKLFRLNFILLIAFMFLIGNYESFSQTVLPTNSSPVDDAVAPLGWTVLVGSTDISNKDFWAGWAAYPWEDSPVDPPNGHLVWVTGFYSEVVGTTITDLTVGVPYSMSFYMAEMRSNAGGPPALYDGTLKVTVGVDEFLFPFSGGLDNSWSLESLSFVATAVSMPMKFEYETAISNGNFWNISFSDDVVDEECDALTTTVSSTDVCIGDEVTLEASSENGGIIIWDGGVIDGVAFVPPVGATTYTATSDNEDDCEFSVIINVHDPDVTASVNEDVICLGETAIFTGGGADTYVWDMGVTDGVVFEPLSAGTITYTVTGTDAFGCSNTATVDLIVSPLPLINFEFIADGVSSEDGSTGGCIINPVQFNDLTNIDPPGVITEWEWRFGDGSTSTLENPEHTYGAPGTYTVTLTVITEGGCEVTITKEITMVESISIDIISNEPSCFGFSDGSIIINILGGGGGDDVVYEIKDVDGNVLNIDNSNAANSLKAGTYTYSIDDGTACSGTGTVVLSQPEQLDIDITTFDPLCFGDKTGWARINEVFNATGDNDRISYIWNPNPTGNSGIGADSIWNLGFGEYTITINDENGCSNVFDFMIDQPKVLEFVELGYEPAYCRLYDYQKGNGVVKAAMIGGVADYGYLWTNLQTGETSTNSTWGGLNPGEYQMVATDANGCTLTETITVDSLNPRANFEITSDQFTSNYKGTAEIDAHFVNLSEHFANPFNPLADTTFFWNFDSPQGMWILSEDLNESFDKIYEPRDDSYDVDVCLVAINKNGCTDTLCKNIIVYSPIEFDNVNIFSPNGDGANDLFTFEFKSKSIAEFKCVIVDRWGITKTEMSAITDTWDGTDMNGSKCNDGVYFYTYEAITDNGTTLVGQGTVQIVGGGK